MASKGLRAIVLSRYTKVEAGNNASDTPQTLIGYTACYLLAFINFTSILVFIVGVFFFNKR
jgi:hypothetical protein